MKKSPLLFLALLFLVPLVVLYRHQTGRVASSEKRYQRIVSIVPSITELIFAAGAGDQLVGVTDYCTYPPEAKAKEKIGSIVVNYEKVIALKPDVVMSSEGLVHKTNEELRRTGLRVETFEPQSFEEIAATIRKIGHLTGHTEEAEANAREIISRVRKVEAAVRGKPQPTVFFESTYNPLWTAGPNSFPGDAIRRAGGKNIMIDLKNPWAQVSWEVVLKRDPDIILIAHTHTENMESRAGWSGLKAVKANRVYKVPSEEFVLATPRLVLGLERAARLFHGKEKTLDLRP